MKKKQTETKKLSLGRQTLVDLRDKQMIQVVGGLATTSHWISCGCTFCGC